jgi:hypothetical protein
MTELAQRLNEMRDVVAVLLREYHVTSNTRRSQIFEHCKQIARAADQIVGALKLAVRQADHEAATTQELQPEYAANMARFAREGFHAMQHSASFIARGLEILRSLDHNSEPSGVEHRVPANRPCPTTTCLPGASTPPSSQPPLCPRRVRTNSTAAYGHCQVN